jgi:hypothetical protein
MLKPTVTAKSYSCSYADPILLEGRGDGDVFMEHYANYDEGTITIRLTYDGGDDSWLAIGINEYGDHHMANSIAVVGDVERGVKFYWMTSDSRDASGVWALNDIHRQLQDTSFLQENEQSILEFTMNLAIADEDQNATVYHVISEDSVWIWAAGLPGNQWQGNHRTRGYFSGLVLHDGCELIEEVASSNTTKGESVAETEEGDNMDMSPSETMSPSTSTVTVTVTEEEDEDLSTSEMTSSSASTSTSHSAVDESEAGIRRLWVSHGILMGIAWGVFAPLAIGASYLKRLKFLQNGAIWLRLHFYLAFSVAIFTIIGFVLAVAATKQEGDLTHFQKDVHHKAGLAISLLIVVQVVAGCFRPTSNAPQEKNGKKDASSMNFSDTSELDGEEGREELVEQDIVTDNIANKDSRKIAHGFVSTGNISTASSVSL